LIVVVIREMRRIYLDDNASPPIDARVAEAMHAAAGDGYRNPSSPHWAGAPAKVIVENSRRQVAAVLGCAPQAIVFTSGGSESDDATLKGMFFARGAKAAHLITTRVEHRSILSLCEFLKRQGAGVPRRVDCDR
jgi:cysteine desulfurase